MAELEQSKAAVLSKSREIYWIKVLFLLQVNVSFLCALNYVLFDCMWRTLIFTFVSVIFGHLGLTAGAHRLWAHKSYTATPGLRFFLVFCQTLVGNGSVYDWVRWHRLHHKHFGTELDPYNPSRGFWYAHVKSLTLRLSPAQQKALEEIDMSDVEQDNIVMFQKKWYWPLAIILVLLLPINTPAEYWGEDMVSAAFVGFWFKYAISMHLSWLIHSASKIWGLEPGEKYPADTNLVFILTKSYWLSYHYLAPWDYQTSEFGKYGTDCTSKFIRVCAALDLATDLKTISPQTVRNALTKSVVEKKHITQCLMEACAEQDLPADHYLTPSKHYQFTIE